MIDKEKAKLDPRKQWAKFIVVLVLYLLFLFWVFNVTLSYSEYSEKQKQIQYNIKMELKRDVNANGGAMPKVLHASSCRG